MVDIKELDKAISIQSAGCRVIIKGSRYAVPPAV